MSVEATQAKAAERIEKGISDLTDLVEKQDAEIKKFGAAKDKTVEQIKAQEKLLAEMGEEVKGAMTRLDEFEKKAGRPGYMGGNDSPDVLPGMGQLFVMSEEYSRLVKGAKTCDPVEIGSTFAKHQASAVRQLIKSDPRIAEAIKSLSNFPTSGGYAASAGQAVIQPMRRQDIIGDPLREPRIRDLLSVAPTNSNAIESVVETELHQLYAFVAADADALATAIVVDNASGFYAGQTIGIRVGSTTQTVKVSAVNTATETLTVTPGVTGAVAAGSEVFSDTFAFTAETRLKPNGNAKFDTVMTPVKTLPHGIPMTRQILEDAPRLAQFIENRLLEGLYLAEESQILYGDGSGEQLQGIMTHADVPGYKWSDGIVGDLHYDAIRRAVLLARKAEYQVTGMVLHPDEVAEIELAKGEDGHYMYIVMSEAQGRRLWRIPYVETTAIKSGEGLVGAFRQGATLFDRAAATVRISDHHKDFFMRNMVQFLMEERIALEITRPQAFVSIDFDAAPTE